MLSEFLDCLYPVSCVPNVVRVSGLSLSCVPNVVRVSGLSLSCVFFPHCFQRSRNCDNIGYTRHRTKIRENQRGNQEWTIQKLWQHWVHRTETIQKLWQHLWFSLIFVLCLVYPMLSQFLDCPCLIAPLLFCNLCPVDTGQRLLKSKGAIKHGQSRNSDNIGYTRHRTKIRENQRGNQEWTIQKLWQHWVHKTQDKGYRKSFWIVHSWLPLCFSLTFIYCYEG
jgi:hypothetical protein